MCNAYNHPPGCNCGWGGGVKYTTYNHIKTKEIPSIPKRFPVKLEIIDGNTENVVTLENNVTIKVTELLSETKPINCRFCGMKVYYYENKTGSKVFFEGLGKPWIKHECKEYLEFKNNKK